MLKITKQLSEENYDKVYQTYYKFFLSMDGLITDKLFKNSPRNPIRKSVSNALSSIKDENTSFYLYYINEKLVSFGRIYQHDNILHLGEMLFTQDEDKAFIIDLILQELELYATSNNYVTLEIEIPKSNTDLINLVLANDYSFVEENPTAQSLFKTYVLYKDIYERTNSSKQR